MKWFDAAERLLSPYPWRDALQDGEVPLLATTAGVLSGQILLLTTQRLLVFPKHQPEPSIDLSLAGLRIDRPRKRRDYLVVSQGSEAHDFKAVVAGADELIELAELFPTRDLLGTLERINAAQWGDTELFEMNDSLSEEIDDLTKERDADEAERYAQISVDLFRDDHRFLPSIERELQRVNGVRNPHESGGRFPLYVVEDALDWTVVSGQTVMEGDEVAVLDGTIVTAPASGTVEIYDLDERVRRLYGVYYWDEYQLEASDWIVEPTIGRILIDTSLVPDRRPVRTRPAPMRIRTPADAEEAAARWIRYWGVDDALVTAAGADGGKDVDAREVVAQVKAHANPIGRPDIQNLYGVATAEGKTPLFFSLSDYTRQASEWADQVGVALFLFDLEAVPEPVNLAARRFVNDRS